MAKGKAGRLAKRTPAPRSRSGTRPAAKAKSRSKSRQKAAVAKKRPSAATRRTPAGTKKVVARKSKATPRKQPSAARKKPGGRKAAARAATPAKPTGARPAPRKAPKHDSGPGPGHTSRVERERRVLADIVQTPPSSLDMDRHGSAARTGRAEMAEHAAQHATMTPDITGGDVDVNTEDAYFTGDEAPGGDNQTPDQDVVDDIGRALGVEYQDSEELRSGDKVADRDKHRWELDPASAEDYRERKR